MFSQSGSKTDRHNLSVKSRDSSLKQTHADSPHESTHDDYFQKRIKSPSSPKSQKHSTSIKKITVTTPGANEYYFNGKDAVTPSAYSKKSAKNPPMNINTEFQPPYEPVAERSHKALTSRELKTKSIGKLNYNNETNPHLDLASIDHTLKSEGLNSTASPKVKLSKENGPQRENSKTIDLVSASQSKNQMNTCRDTSPDYKDSSPEVGSKSTVSGSHRRSSTRQDPNWEGLKLPVTPQYVLENFSLYLSPYEKEEIQKYSQIYYISDIYHKIIAREEQEYENERGDYLVVKNDHIKYRYEALEMLGKGSFGQVIKVYDHKRKEYAAVKIIRSPKKFHFQAKIEIRILKFMMENSGADYNIVGLRDYFSFRNHVCLVFDLMDMNLYDLLKKNKYRGFPLSTIRKFAIQVLYALKFLSHNKIIHCDLKPENILLKQPNKTGIKIIDFGSSCFENEKLYTYIQSRFYRSPEIILGLPYSSQIDMWSFGCLLCELYLGYPIFAGESEFDQLMSMFEVLGVPDKNFINASSRKAKFFNDDLIPLSVPNSKGKVRVPNATPLVTFIKPEDHTFLDLVRVYRSCLEFDPQKRFNPDHALSHEWIIEGLPPQLKAQHLKFIQDTTREVPKEEVVSPKVRNLSSRHASKPTNTTEETNYNPETPRAPKKDKTGTNFYVNQAQEEKHEKQHEDYNTEGDEKGNMQFNPSKTFTRKLNGAQTERLTLKAVYKPISTQESKANSTKNANQLYINKDAPTHLSTKSNFESTNKNYNLDFGKYLQKKGSNDETFGKKSLVGWESATNRRTGNEDNGYKPTFDINQLKKTYQNHNLASPKSFYSPERVSTKNDKESVLNKGSLLPSIKHAIMQKNK